VKITERKAALIASILASSMALIDSSALNVALPEIQAQLGLTGIQLLWVVNAYLLFLASLMLAGGAMGDVYGKKKVFVIGISAFALASLGCGFSTTGGMLILLRGLQGVAGALMVPGSLALITAVYPSNQRGQAIGYWSMFSAITTISGPAIGGYLASIGFWRGVFFINIPLAAIALFLLLKKVKEPEIRKVKSGPDWKGAFFSSLGFTGIVYALLQAGEVGVDKWHLWLIFLTGVGLLIAFFRQEKKVAEPMLKLPLFNNKTFSAAAALTFMVYGGLGIFLYFLPLNLIQHQGYTALQAGIAVLPFGGLIAVLAPLTGKWSDKHGYKRPLTFGPLITGTALMGMTFFESTEGWSSFVSTFLPFMLLAGGGMGITVVPVTSAIMGCVDEKDSGTASGISNAMSRLSGVIALSIVGMVSLLYFEADVLGSFSDDNLSIETMNQLREEASKFSGSTVVELPDEIKEKAESVFQSAFFAAFDRSCYIAGSLCYLGAILAMLFIPKGKFENQ
jgi:EmrB/QacA subfamily drug resistance transporter